ncbi:IPP transferase-domain-containing protein [Phaeosphaeria sp. MPI-PUGE-AT-0046c]|nr:IPP transferase-domain-containing protein [Phaeosphaeria sp. MPI-PUGE-AT-0046c]
MQLYEGLPIITNKISAEEMKGVPHHLLGRIGLQEETWTVGKFVSNALSTIGEIRNRGKIPILVGGTHYYTQSLLFHDALSTEKSLEPSNESERYPILEKATEIIHAKLREVDPVMADRWHPNERRKIQRSLGIFLKTGKPASQVYAEQRLKKGQSPIDSPENIDEDSTGMRFQTLVFWVHARKDNLYSRLDGRVEKMLAKGLLQEVDSLANFKKGREAEGQAVDESRGIWVSIGYKEFAKYQQALAQESKSEKELTLLKTEGIEKTQAATRQYANRQLKWIQIKLLNAFIEASQQDNVFLFDGTDISAWSSNVVQPALQVAEQFLSGQNLPAPSSLSAAAAEMLVPKRNYDLGQRPDLWQKRTCETCGMVAVTENDWQQHVKSRTHRRAVGVEKKQKNTEKMRKESRTKVQADLVDVLQDYMHTFPDTEDSRGPD